MKNKINNMKMKTYFVEIVCGETKKYGNTVYLRGIVNAIDNEHAERKALEHYVPYYTGGDKGRFYVQCCWKHESPTKKVVTECFDNLMKTEMAMAVRDNDGTTIGHRYFNVFDDKKEVIKDWERCNMEWSDIYYDPKENGYIVLMNSYMCKDVIAKVFKGNTAEIYNEACEWVKKNTLKKDYFAFKFGKAK